MSEYNEFATALETAFKEASKAHNAAYEAYTAAQTAADNAGKYHEEHFIGERKLRQEEAAAALNRAKAELRMTAEKAWQKYDRAVSSLSAQLSERIAASSTVDTSKVDAAAVEVLKSGACEYNDFVTLAEKYSDNGTMLKIIAKYAENRADECGRIYEANRLTQPSAGTEARNLKYLVTKIRNASQSVADTWNSIVYNANIMSGRDANGNVDSRRGYYMSNRWDELMKSAIESF